MNNNHLNRLESSLKRTISDIIMYEVKNNIGFVTITDVSLTSDYSYLTVYYTVLSDKDKKKAREGLESSKSFIRYTLVNRVQMRKAPELIFKLDTSYENGKKIDELLKEIQNNKMPN